MTQEIQYGTWRKSSRSQGGGACVEWAWAEGRPVQAVGVRDSKQSGRGPVLAVSRTAAAALVAAIRSQPASGA